MFDREALSRHPLSHACLKNPPLVFLVLGSGFAEVSKSFSTLQSWPFGSIPGMNPSRVHGHKGALTLAYSKGIHLLVSEGRIHHYEGHSQSEVCTLVHVAKAMGCKTSILTNAAGGIHPILSPGAMMVLENHIVLPGTAWNSDKTKPGIFQEEKSPYSPRLIQLAMEILAKEQVPHIAGKYLMVSGPCYETPAEIRAFQTIGADAVGMSTAWEAQESQKLGMECLAISGISNKAAGLGPGLLLHQDIVENGKPLGKCLEKLLDGILEKLCRF